MYGICQLQITTACNMLYSCHLKMSQHSSRNHLTHKIKHADHKEFCHTVEPRLCGHSPMWTPRCYGHFFPGPFVFPYIGFAVQPPWYKDHLATKPLSLTPVGGLSIKVQLYSKKSVPGNYPQLSSKQLLNVHMKVSMET